MIKKMKKITKKELKQRLKNEFGYSASGAKLITDQLAELNPEILSAFEKWWICNELPSIEIEGYTAQLLIKDHNQNPIAAFLTLSWLADEPNKAKEALTRGYDHISN
jgi:hypothetical protein